MAAITDLTWQQISDASAITGAIAVANGKVMIDVGLLTGQSVAALTSMGVIDFMLKLRDFAVTAQATANTSQAVGERLAAFPALVYGALQADGTVQVQGNVVGKMKISPQAIHIVGTNV